MAEKVTLRSMIKKFFTKDLLFEIDKITMHHDIDNNTKAVLIDRIFKAHELPVSTLGTGTNRHAVLLEDYVLKIALDEDGKIDNKREFIYSYKAQPYVFKVYECMANGLLCVGEYYEVFQETDFEDKTNQREMIKILNELSKIYLIGDIGLDKKNYTNWGYRPSDHKLGILDYAYIYDLSYKTFQCTCEDHGMLVYNGTFTYLQCPFCGKKYEFADVRRRVTRKEQAEEIGDIREKGYVVTEYETKVDVNPEFSHHIKPKKKKEKEKETPKKKKPIDISKMDGMSMAQIEAAYYEKLKGEQKNG